MSGAGVLYHSGSYLLQAAVGVSVVHDPALHIALFFLKFCTNFFLQNIHFIHGTLQKHGALRFHTVPCDSVRCAAIKCNRSTF